MNDNQTYYRLAKELNNLTISDIAHITGRTDRVVESHLYEAGRSPGWREVYLLVTALKVAGGSIPIELVRYLSADLTRISRWGTKSNPSKSRYTVVGERIKKNTYIFRGDELTISGISRKTGMLNQTIYIRIKKSNANVGEDVTDIICAQTKIGRPLKNERTTIHNLHSGGKIIA